MTLMLQRCFVGRLAEAFFFPRKHDSILCIDDTYSITASFTVYIINPMDQKVKITFFQQL
jgi:hypothetical protein